VRDIGIVASTDPVAIDQASADLVNREAASPHLPSSQYGAGEDKFKGIYPNVEWRLQLDYAEQIGLGSKNYELNLIWFSDFFPSIF